MADYQKKEGQGSLFTNHKKQTDNQPDMTGSVVINGVEMRIAAWWKQPRNGGEEYLSVSISPFQQQAQQPQRPEPHAVNYRHQSQPNPQYQRPAPQQAPQQGNPFEPQADDLPF